MSVIASVSDVCFRAVNRCRLQNQGLHLSCHLTPHQHCRCGAFHTLSNRLQGWRVKVLEWSLVRTHLFTWPSRLILSFWKNQLKFWKVYSQSMSNRFQTDFNRFFINCIAMKNNSTSTSWVVKEPHSKKLQKKILNSFSATIFGQFRPNPQGEICEQWPFHSIQSRLCWNAKVFWSWICLKTGLEQAANLMTAF